MTIERFLNMPKSVGFIYTFTISMLCAILNITLGVLFLWWLDGACVGKSICIAIVLLFIDFAINFIFNTFWRVWIISPASWLVRHKNIYRKANSVIIILVNLFAIILLYIVSYECGWFSKSQFIILGGYVGGMFAQSISTAKLQYRISCYMYVEEFNTTPKLYCNEAIDQKACDIYWQEKVKQTFNTIKFYGYISTNNKEA